MKSILLPLLCLGLLAACNEATHSPDEVTTTASGSSSVGETVDLQAYELTALPGTDWQLAEQRNEEGEVEMSGYVDAKGQKQGSWTTWKGSRSPTLVANYINGVLNGLYQEMDAVGRVTKVAHYLDGQLHGRYAEYRAGITQKTASYQRGQLHGTYREHTLQTGKVNRSIEYKNGKPDGPMRWFNDAGELIQERLYNNGELVE